VTPGDLPVVDNLYLDINGIIYKCVKDEANLFKDFVKSKAFDEIWQLIMNALNEIVKMVNP
jgi:5'-3' exonuclease